MRAFFSVALILAAISPLSLAAADPATEDPGSDQPTIKPGAAAAATHEEVQAIEVKGEQGATLQTLAITPSGTVVGLVAPAKYAPIGESGNAAAPSEIRLFDTDGKESQRWSLPFTAQSVAAGPDGAIYVAGSGRIARYAADGKLLVAADVPHLAEVLNDKVALRQRAEKQLKMEQESVGNATKSFEEQIKRLEDKGEANLTDLEKKQLAAYRSYLKSYDTQRSSVAKRTIDDVIKSLTSRLRIVNGIAVSDKDVFIACGELKGYGYAIWRLDLEFTKAERVLGPVSGCCGQMDVQAAADGIYIAENTKKRVAHYDREGKFVAAFGTSGRESDGLSFGGCCNPMNCRLAPGGDIYTAESEGIVKRFSHTGEFLGLVGYAKLTGGCKNVAVAASPKGDRIYFCDLPGSRILILQAKKAPAAIGGQ